MHTFLQSVVNIRSSADKGLYSTYDKQSKGRFHLDKPLQQHLIRFVKQTLRITSLNHCFNYHDGHISVFCIWWCISTTSVRYYLYSIPIIICVLSIRICFIDFKTLEATKKYKWRKNVCFIQFFFIIINNYYWL